MKAWKALEIKDLIHKNKFWWKTKSISSFLLLKTVCKLKNQNWRQKNTSLCFSLNSKIQILVSDWASFYWLLPIGYSSFWPPFLKIQILVSDSPPHFFLTPFSPIQSLSLIGLKPPVDYNSACYWSEGGRSHILLPKK